MLKIINKTGNALSIENVELPGNSSINVDIPYTSNLRMMERNNVIAVINIQNNGNASDETVSRSVRKGRRTNKQ